MRCRMQLQDTSDSSWDETPKLYPNTWEDLVNSIEEHVCVGPAFSQPRTLEKLKKYRDFKISVLEVYASLNDYVLVQFFNCDSVMVESKIRAKISQKERGEIVWRPNDFPPFLEDGIQLQILWICESKRIDNTDVEALIMEHIDCENFEYVWGRSSSGTISEVDHAHVFYRRKKCEVSCAHALLIREKSLLHGLIDQKSELVIERFLSGYVNYVYHVSDLTRKTDFVFRIVGSRDIPRFPERENRSFQFFYESKIGPKPYFQHDEWRIEEFIPGATLTKQVFRNDKKIRMKCAQLLAKIHGLKPKFETCFSYKEPTDLINMVKKSIDIESANCVLQHSLEEIEMRIWRLGERMKQITPVRCFCHNDFKPSNIINNKGELFVVDIEVSGFNFRGIEIAFLLLVGIHRECNSTKLREDGFPTDEIFRNFAVEYLTNFYGRNPTKTEVLKILKEIEFGYLVNLLKCWLFFGGMKGQDEAARGYLEQYDILKDSLIVDVESDNKCDLLDQEP